MLSNELYERCLKVAPGGVHSPVRAFKAVGGTPIFFKETTIAKSNLKGWRDNIS